jgi:cohesin complex subunit SA-1/2
LYCILVDIPAHFMPDDAPPKGKRKRADSGSEDDDDDPKPKRKAKQSPAAKKPRKTRKPKDGEDAFDPQQAAKESKINADNPLFSPHFRYLVFKIH